MRLLFEAGHSYPDIRTMTPFVAGLAIEAYGKKAERDAQARRWHGWHTGMIAAGRMDVGFEDFMGIEQDEQSTVLLAGSAFKAWAQAHNRRQREKQATTTASPNVTEEPDA